VALTEGFSGADVTQLCKEAAMGALRAGAWTRGDSAAQPPHSQPPPLPRPPGGVGAGMAGFLMSGRTGSKADLPPITDANFRDAFDAVKASVSPSELDHYVKWNREFGSEASPKALDVMRMAAAGKRAPVAGGAGGRGAGE
jgi:SpoVK/Ycf46/Vps4 family AAA+-type ATPase